MAASGGSSPRLRDWFSLKILVLGANGLLGSYLGFSLPNHRFLTFGLSRSPASHFANLRIRESVEEFLPEILSGGFDVVINCVANTSVDACQVDPDNAFAVNAVAAEKFAHAARVGESKFVQISTDAVFSGEGDGHYSECSETNPATVYGLSKLMGEELVRAEYPESLILRTNFFGWSPRSDRGVLDFFVSAMEAGKQVVGYTDYTVSSIYVADLVEMMIGLLLRPISGTFHLGARSPISKYQFGKHVAEVGGLDASILKAGLQPLSRGHALRGRNLGLDSTLAATTIGKPLATTSSGIKRAYAERDSVRKFFDCVR